MKITYAITACNEHVELERLLKFLRDNIRAEDEVIIQLDINHTDAVLEVCNLYTNFNHGGHVEAHAIKNSKFYAFPLDGDFARFKNQLATNATGDYIYQIDADEMISDYACKLLPQVLQHNLVDVILVPRINTVDGLTEEHVARWRWQVNSKGWVNFPDSQWRIYRNNSEIKWKNRVHEVLEGYKTIATLPATETQTEWCLLHPKTITRQEQQNKFYSTL